MLLAMAAAAAAQSASMPPPENPATGIWIQQVGDIVPHAATKATLYYTKYEKDDRVKSISYQYDGAGYLLMKPSDKKTLCTMTDGLVGADGIVHHPDGDLLVAGQNREIHKVSKTAKDSSKQCLVKTSYPKQSTNGFWHLMMDPNQKWLWAAGIPGYLFRYSTKTDPAVGNFASNGYKVTLRPKSTNRRKDDKLSTVIWDGDGNAYFTYSDYAGGGCEAGGGYATCTPEQRKASSANAYFGRFTDTTWTTVTRENQSTVGGEIGESVITSVGTEILIDSLEGAHGGAYDTYSKTIFVFGGSRIVQIQPYKDVAGNQRAKVVAVIDLREFFFTESKENMTGPRTPGVGWRLDQGTTDGYGHLFVAANTGHMIFVDYAANPKKLINDNVLVHMQWIDNYLDDLAPLSGVGIVREGGHTGDDDISSASQSSSSLVEYQESSSSAKSSSSTGSSNSTGNSSGSENNGSSNSTGNSSGSEDGGSSGSTGNSSGSEDGGSSGSTGNSSDSEDGGSSSSKGNGSGEDIDNPSSSSRYYGSGDDVDTKSSSSRMYYGADDVDYDDDSGLDNYPSADDFEKGDSLVKKTVILEPTDPDPKNPKIVVIAGNSYLLTDDPKGIPMDLRFDAGLDSAKVGDINGEKTDKLVVNADGSVTFFVTADQVVKGGTIKVYGGGEMVVIDNINFYDPIPDSRMGYIKDSDNDMAFDYLEILLKDTLPESYYLEGVKLVVGGKTYDCVNPTIKGDRIQVDVSGLNLPGVGEFPKDAKALITYGDKEGSGATYQREAPVVEMGSNVIKDAYAIRSSNGLDSLFLQFNIDLMPVDVGSPDMLVMLKQEGARYGLDEVLKVYMPAKDIVILVGKTFKLKGSYKDSVSLYPTVTFESLPYITSDEYEREVPVKVVDRFPSSKNVEYWDTDGNGVLDKIVAVFDRKLTQADIDSTLYMSFPWYSYRGMMIQLQAQPADLKIDPNDSTRVIWEVASPTRLAEGVTSISDKLPEANIYTYYKVFDETFVNEETAALVDKMSPVVASATLNYGKKADTLLVVFSEPINHKDLKSNDYFSYIHGEETIELNPTRIDWSPDGLSAKLVFNGSQGTIMPGDSLVVHKGLKDAIKDNYGNIAGENPQSVIIGGLLNHLVEATKMGSFDVNDDRIVDEDSNKTYTLQTVSSVNLRYVPGTTTKEDMEKEGALGQLVQLGERFVPQLLDRAQVSADGSYDPSVLDSLKPEDVYISFIVNYFDHLGQYVNDTVITVPCNSPKFGGNCLETDKKVFVNWNFKDHKGRFVGTGIYNVQFKMIVRYENRKIEEQIKDKWGVRRKKHKK